MVPRQGQDANTGLQYFGARYYDPVVGRFMGVDPVGVDPGNLHSGNRYAYGNNNPYRYRDPDGNAAGQIVLMAGVWMGGGALVGGGFNALTQLITNGEVRWGGVGGVIDAAGDGAMLGPVFGAAAIRSAPARTEAVGAAGGGKTFIVPKEKVEFADSYRQAAEAGTLVRTDPSSVRGAGFRKQVEKEHGAPPGKGYDADHRVELCVGGANCAKTNGQWLESSPNRAAGSKIGNQVKNDPIGTKYTKVKVEE